MGRLKGWKLQIGDWRLGRELLAGREKLGGGGWIRKAEGGMTWQGVLGERKLGKDKEEGWEGEAGRRRAGMEAEGGGR